MATERIRCPKCNGGGTLDVPTNRPYEPFSTALRKDRVDVTYATPRQELTRDVEDDLRAQRRADAYGQLMALVQKRLDRSGDTSRFATQKALADLLRDDPKARELYATYDANAPVSRRFDRS